MLAPTNVLSLYRINPDGEDDWRFRSAHPPNGMGPGDMAFGGSTLALAIHAAYHTLPQDRALNMRIYSVLGHFHGLTKSTIPLEIAVKSLRDTRSFATRQVTVQQALPPDTRKPRTTCVLLIDFIAKAGSRTLIAFSEAPLDKNITHHSKLDDLNEALEKEVKAGTTDPMFVRILSSYHALNHDLWHNRYCPEGVIGQISVGAKVERPTNQDTLPFAQRRSYDWLKSRHDLPEQSTPANRDQVLLPPHRSAASAAMFAHFLDTWMSVIVPWWAHMDARHAQVFATLDFALRFHVDDLDASAWHLRQHTAMAAGDERNYAQANLYREEAGKDHTLVATMTQTCALKGFERKAAKL
ncbi:hypothetical protein K461DRAFT_273277 [Myriangium duriaei CBS 260.36]|uniref:Acyl-CoA thioesterase II n=1 Tax=Myriangium duriaei CBS 260.36 TaxID=1168546 RepID=A0A9P4J8R4_9PEZI|nr:hypothetical protein K461DRAFT_273277 [Myriangium duriaei CBS 260.36]